MKNRTGAVNPLPFEASLALQRLGANLKTAR